MPRFVVRLIFVFLGTCALLSPFAEAGAPQPVKRVPLPAPKDQPFRGTITLEVDATDTRHAVVSVHEVIPVQKSGDMVLLYPEWETASHAPTVPVASLAGLIVKADGQRVAWRRDPFDVHAFHVPVRAGAKEVSVDLQYLADQSTLNEGALGLPWQRVLLYPAGWFARNLPVAATLRVAPGLTLVTSLEGKASQENTYRFAPVTLEHLVDAPVFAARASRQIDLAPGERVPVRLDMLARAQEDLAISDRETALLRAMVVQTRKVFGQPPFRHYDAVVMLDDALGPGGIEHLEEGENDLPLRYFSDPASQLNNRDLIAHELVHAWNGRFRQPADLWTPNFNEPVGGSLLWVYEGQSEFWGRVLAARAGLRSIQESLDKLALDAAVVANRPARSWKSLADSNNDAVYMAGHRVVWRDWQRREDYYPEGVLLWLDVDARIQELTGGKRGLDDFAFRFFRANKPDGGVSTYTFQDVCRALNAVARDDWANFLRRHLDTHDDAIAIAGLARMGWQLVYKPEPSETFRQNEADEGGLDLTYSIGAVVRRDGRVEKVAWDSPMFRAGAVPGARIKMVSGSSFSPEALLAAVAKTPQQPLQLDFGSGSVELGYRGGLRYPYLEPIPGRPDRLSRLLATR